MYISFQSKAIYLSPFQTFWRAKRSESGWVPTCRWGGPGERELKKKNGRVAKCHGLSCCWSCCFLLFWWWLDDFFWKCSLPHDLRIGQPFCGEYQDRKDLYPLQGERYMTRARCFAASSVVVQEQNVKCNERAVYKKLGLPANSQATDHLSRADWSWKIASSYRHGEDNTASDM